ncbi:hypothetical protein WJX77_003004 [Trebouxia sp. C0004]
MLPLHPLGLLGLMPPPLLKALSASSSVLRKQTQQHVTCIDLSLEFPQCILKNLSNYQSQPPCAQRCCTFLTSASTPKKCICFIRKLANANRAKCDSMAPMSAHEPEPIRLIRLAAPYSSSNAASLALAANNAYGNKEVQCTYCCTWMPVWGALSCPLSASWGTPFPVDFSEKVVINTWTPTSLAWRSRAALWCCITASSCGSTSTPRSSSKQEALTSVQVLLGVDHNTTSLHATCSCKLQFSCDFSYLLPSHVDDLEVVGKPDMCLVAIKSASNKLKIYKANDLLS